MEIDVLGHPYEQMYLDLNPDDEGEVVATLIRRRADEPTDRAVLYLHGFNDYFFQTHLADFYTARGFDFYALDLRKYGRSLRPHQTPNFCRDLSEYDEEIDTAVQFIRNRDRHRTVLLNGHSTGGLISVLWADRRRGQGLVQGVFLNSPFFEFNLAWTVRNTLGPLIRRTGRSRPYAKLPGNLGTVYGRSIHRDHLGEWDFDLAWKPLAGFQVRAGWINAIARAHRQVQAGLDIDVPVLVAYSARSFRGRRFTEAARSSDAVINVADVTRFGPGLGRLVTLTRIEGGLHDLALSAPAVRKRLFGEVDRWLGGYLGVSGVREPETAEPEPASEAAPESDAAPESQAATAA